MSRRLCIPLLSETVCHGYTVGLSADISTASVSPTASVFVPSVYHRFGANGEESLNKSLRFYGLFTNDPGQAFRRGKDW